MKKPDTNNDKDKISLMFQRGKKIIPSIFLFKLTIEKTISYLARVSYPELSTIVKFRIVRFIACSVIKLNSYAKEHGASARDETVTCVKRVKFVSVPGVLVSSR